MTFFGNYDPASFGWTFDNGAIPFRYNNVPFPQGVANADVSKIFTRILDLIVPRMRDTLGVNHDCWGYEPRDVIGQPGTKSFHGYGIAIDVNATTNGQTTMPMGLSTTTLPLNTGAIIHPLGAEWGGDWTASSPRDPMHIEIHLSPAEAHDIAGSLGPVNPPIQGKQPMLCVVFAPNRAAAYIRSDGTRTGPMSKQTWTAVNHLAKLGGASVNELSDTDFDAFPLH